MSLTLRKLSQSRKIIYLLRDQYNSPLAAGSVNGTAAEPGPGLRTVTDSGNHLSLAGGLLTFDGGLVVPAYNDPIVRYGTAFTRTNGLIFQIIANSDANIWQAGFFSTSNPLNNAATGRSEILMGSGGSLFIVSNESGATPTVGTITVGADTRYSIVLRATGAYVFEGTTLIFVLRESTISPVYACILSRNSSVLFDYMAIARLRNRVFLSDFALASFNVDLPTSSSNFVSTANAINDFDFALPGLPNAGDMIELRYRIQDATNYWTAYLKRNVGNTAWDFWVDLVTAGVPANKVNVNGVGSPTTLRVRVTSSVHDFFTKAGSAWNKRGGTVTDATLSSSLAVSPVYVAGTTAVKIVSWPTI